MFEYVSEAFYIAKTERRPVVLGIPTDLQQVQIPTDIKYVPSADLIPDTGPVVPHPDYVNRAVEGIAQAERIIIIAGRGAQLSDAKALCEQLAERCNGLLATTLPVRGFFEGNPRFLGIAGGFSHPAARQAFRSIWLLTKSVTPSIGKSASLSSAIATGILLLRSDLTSPFSTCRW